MNTLDLQQAAELLKIHPVTLQSKAKAGEIPGAKIGRSWVFLTTDLANYIRSKYTHHGERITNPTQEEKSCSLKEPAQIIGISNSPFREKQYTDLLAPVTKGKRKK